LLFRGFDAGTNLGINLWLVDLSISDLLISDLLARLL